MTKEEIRDFLATGGLGLIFTPKDEKKDRDDRSNTTSTPNGSNERDAGQTVEQKTQTGR